MHKNVYIYNKMMSIKDNYQPEPKHRILLVFGPTQFGKSTFINNLLNESKSMSPRAKVGNTSEIGESITVTPQTFNIGNISDMFPEDRINFDTLQIIDVPGILHGELLDSKDELLNEIKRALLEKKKTTLDAILCFESMKDDARKLKLTMCTLTELFGPSALNSVIVLSTKWDRVHQDDLEQTETYFNAHIKALGLKTIKWKNNIENKQLASPEEMKYQLSMLGNIINSLIPYSVNGMEELIHQENERSKKIMNENTDMAINNPEEFIGEIEIDTIEWIPISEEEINEKAMLFENTTQNMSQKDLRVFIKTFLGLQVKPKQVRKKYHIKFHKAVPEMQNFEKMNKMPLDDQE